jgi:ketosteroid isomerase-like protein
MSENLDLVRSIYAALERGDYSSAEWADPEIEYVSAERVLVLTRNSGRGKKSGLPVGSKGAELFEIHTGKVTRIVVWTHRDRAFADLGLTE